MKKVIKEDDLNILVVSHQWMEVAADPEDINLEDILKRDLIENIEIPDADLEETLRSVVENNVFN
jgi:hypothetical protein